MTESVEGLRRGPEPAGDNDLARRRYNLSALVNDLDGSDDPDELRLVAAAACLEATELTLTTHGRWLGAGKWCLCEFASSTR